MSDKEDFVGLSNAVHDMFTRSNEGIRSTTGDTGHGKVQATSYELASALTVLLVELASSDQDFAPEEYSTILHGIQRVFGTDPTETRTLIQQAQLKLSNLRATDYVAELLKEHASVAQRQQMLQLIDQVINADGVLDGFEVYHRYRLLKLLGLEEEVPPADS